MRGEKSAVRFTPNSGRKSELLNPQSCNLFALNHEAEFEGYRATRKIAGQPGPQDCPSIPVADSQWVNSVVVSLFGIRFPFFDGVYSNVSTAFVVNGCVSRKTCRQRFHISTVLNF